MSAHLYYCDDCDQRVEPDSEPSPCEGHAVGPCCAPCRDCREEEQAAAAGEERRQEFAEWCGRGLLGEGAA